MFRERNEWPSTAGEAEERSGYMELCDVAAQLATLLSILAGIRAPPQDEPFPGRPYGYVAAFIRRASYGREREQVCLSNTFH